MRRTFACGSGGQGEQGVRGENDRAHHGVHQTLRVRQRSFPCLRRTANFPSARPSARKSLKRGTSASPASCFPTSSANSPAKRSAFRRAEKGLEIAYRDAGSFCTEPSRRRISPHRLHDRRKFLHDEQEALKKIISEVIFCCAAGRFPPYPQGLPDGVRRQARNVRAGRLPPRGSQGGHRRKERGKEPCLPCAHPLRDRKTVGRRERRDHALHAGRDAARQRGGHDRRLPPVSGRVHQKGERHPRALRDVRHRREGGAHRLRRARSRPSSAATRTTSSRWRSARKASKFPPSPTSATFPRRSRRGWRAWRRPSP